MASEHGDQETTRVVDAAGLTAAIKACARVVEVAGVISDLASLAVPAGTQVSGSEGAELRFANGQPGLMLGANATVTGLRLVTDEAQVALGLLDDADDLGSILIERVTAVGRVHLEGSRARSATLVLRDVHVDMADARMAAHRPAGYGVEALLGGISVYNRSADVASRWLLEARNLSAGSADRPIRGSGVFVFGGASIPLEADPATAPAPSREGGTIEVAILTTGDVHVDGGIPPGTGNLISGGVFLGSGAHAREVINEGAVTTYGPNDMVLDNWGRANVWTARAAVTSHGASGIGFVNFGGMDVLKIDGPIETHGTGARGFNLYDGTLGEASFDGIATHGDGAVGIQVSRPFGSIRVERDVRTTGGEGDSLVKGKVMHLKAHAISLKAGARGDAITVGGVAVAEQAGIEDWEFEAPATSVGSIQVRGAVVAG